MDETSLRVDRKNHWIHVYAAGDITLKRLHRKRGKEAINEINIVPRRHSGVIIHDCWAKNIKKLLQQTCIAVADSDDKKLDLEAYANLLKRYRNIITRGKKELPDLPERPTGKRGRLAKSDTHNLWERLKKHESADHTSITVLFAT